VIAAQILVFDFLTWLTIVFAGGLGFLFLFSYILSVYTDHRLTIIIQQEGINKQLPKIQLPPLIRIFSSLGEDISGYVSSIILLIIFIPIAVIITFVFPAFIPPPFLDFVNLASLICIGVTVFIIIPAYLVRGVRTVIQQFRVDLQGAPEREKTEETSK
jgi:hypothetical protein